ncbi:uncharacterized protein LOC142938176 [Anarhichas minor]|uniref:uncharacterized protein LOC142938176 n=1 Tax=Anarhichas minor TaxID=65739 RepID=UPI003F73E52E
MAASEAGAGEAAGFTFKCSADRLRRLCLQGSEETHIQRLKDVRRMWWQAQENDPLPLCRPDQLWIQVGLMSVHDEQQRALLHGELQEMPDKPLPKQLTVNVPCWRLPVEGIGNPFLVIGAPWISPLVDDECGDILPSRVEAGQDGDVVSGSLGLPVSMFSPPGHDDLPSCRVQLKPRLVAVVYLTGFLPQPVLLQGGGEEPEILLNWPPLGAGCPPTVNDVWGPGSKAMVLPLPEVYPPRPSTVLCASRWRRL